MRISDWSSDVCSSDLTSVLFNSGRHEEALAQFRALIDRETAALGSDHPMTLLTRMDYAERLRERGRYAEAETQIRDVIKDRIRVSGDQHYWRSEEHTSELHSLMRISYAVFCLKKKKK